MSYRLASFSAAVEDAGLILVLGSSLGGLPWTEQTTDENMTEKILVPQINDEMPVRLLFSKCAVWEPGRVEESRGRGNETDGEGDNKSDSDTNASVSLERR